MTFCPVLEIRLDSPHLVDSSVCDSSGGALLPGIYIPDCKQSRSLQNFLERTAAVVATVTYHPSLNI